jgi:hypothetical protein
MTEEDVAKAYAENQRTKLRTLFDFFTGRKVQNFVKALNEYTEDLSALPGAEATVKNAVLQLTTNINNVTQTIHSQIVMLDQFIDPPEPAPE